MTCTKAKFEQKRDEANETITFFFYDEVSYYLTFAYFENPNTTDLLFQRSIYHCINDMEQFQKKKKKVVFNI
jgi:hypothetical protein